MASGHFNTQQKVDQPCPGTMPGILAVILAVILSETILKGFHRQSGGNGLYVHVTIEVTIFKFVQLPGGWSRGVRHSKYRVRDSGSH